MTSEIATRLQREIRGRVFDPRHPDYAMRRQVWNGAIDRKPSAIVQCVDDADIMAATRIAAGAGVQIAVRGGGHNVAGLSMQDDVVVLDLSLRREISVNPAGRRAIVQGGALWREVDLATSLHKLATTGGLISSTGVGGLTLGGGVGWLMRRYGLACDNVVRADVILASGEKIRISEQENADLMWLLRGGGGRFGIVTEFEYQLHPVSEVLAGLIIHPAAVAADVLRRFRNFAQSAPDEFCGLAVTTHAPPLPFIDKAWHGKPVTILAVCWCGDAAEGEETLAPLREFGKPIASVIHGFPYAQWQGMQDPSAPAGRHQYWKSASFKSLPDAAIDVLAAAAERLPSQVTELHVQHLGGAVARIPESQSAFLHRHADFFINLIGATEDAQSFAQMRDWVRAQHALLARQAIPGMLTNFRGVDDTVTSRSEEGDARSRKIAELRKRLDPHGLFV